MMTLSVTAAAKINLDLRVLGRRNDGYHEVQTLLQTIDLVDHIRATEAPSDVLDLTVEPAAAVPPGTENLVIRAAEALRRHSGVKAGARLELGKRIPIGAGLGGGSSDAAATLVLLNSLWGLNLEPSELHTLAADLGSDVPFFLTGGLALATGRGEVIQPLPDLVAYCVVVCTPPVEVATADVYDLFASRSRLTSEGPRANVGAFAAGCLENAGMVEPPWRELGNDLEPVVIEKWPEVGRAVTALKAMGPLHAAVTGSGAAAFAVFPDFEAAGEGPGSLNPSWNVHVGSTLGRSRGRPAVK